MQRTTLDHIGIAVPSIDEALAFYPEALGIERTEEERLPRDGVRVAFLPTGESRLELLEPLGEESPVARFIARRGAGIHHICLRVPDIASRLEELKDSGIPLIDEEPRRGAGGSLVAFVHPRGSGGVLIELKQEEAEDD